MAGNVRTGNKVRDILNLAHTRFRTGNCVHFSSVPGGIVMGVQKTHNYVLTLSLTSLMMKCCLMSSDVS